MKSIKMKNNYINSCLNYTGNKYRLLPQLMNLFPNDISTFVDLFCGSLSVGINVNAQHTIANDKTEELITLFEAFKENGYEKSLKKIENLISKHNLSADNLNSYLDFRELYNQKKKKDPFMFYLLVCHSFNNQIRFNKSRGFNLPYGKRTFNDSMKSKFEEFVKKLEGMNIDFYDLDFRDIDLTNLDNNDFVYVDCPYLISTASYNENGGWEEKDEKDLYDYLHNLNSHNIRWALSNVTNHKGEKNKLLLEFAKDYNIHEMCINYYNCNYQNINRTTLTREVLVTNY